MRALDRDRMRQATAWLATGLLALSASIARAGPPYFTDDPEPTDLGHWEIYAFGSASGTPSRWDGATGFDLNYGAAKNLQITATLPLDIVHDRGTHIAAGDIELGAKYRFFHNDQAGFSIAVFPRVFIPTAGRRFGSGKVGVLLPIWAQKDFGDWSLFGGGGYTINPGAGNRNFWQSGLALRRTLSPRLSLGGEIAHRGADAAGGRDYTAVNLGAIYRLNKIASVLLSGGPGIAHAQSGGKYNLYAALGLNF